jgi:hypothetical protein
MLLDSALSFRQSSTSGSSSKPGTLVDEEPLQEFIYTAYGYDAQERVLCAAVFQSEELPRSYTYFDYGDETIDSAEFGIIWYTDRYQLHKVGRLVRSTDQTPLYYAEFSPSDGQAQWMIEVYHYDKQARLERVNSRRVRRAVES